LRWQSPSNKKVAARQPLFHTFVPALCGAGHRDGGKRFYGAAVKNIVFSASLSFERLAFLYGCVRRAGKDKKDKGPLKIQNIKAAGTGARRKCPI